MKGITYGMLSTSIMLASVIIALLYFPGHVQDALLVIGVIMMYPTLIFMHYKTRRILQVLGIDLNAPAAPPPLPAPTPHAGLTKEQKEGTHGPR